MSCLYLIGKPCSTSFAEFGSSGGRLCVSLWQAFEALCITYSPYGGKSIGVGDIVPMKLDILSIPEVCGAAIPIVLKGLLEFFFRNPHELMLQDADNWGAVADEVRKIL